MVNLQCSILLEKGIGYNLYKGRYREIGTKEDWIFVKGEIVRNLGPAIIERSEYTKRPLDEHFFAQHLWNTSYCRRLTPQRKLRRTARIENTKKSKYGCQN
jgi:hypothetical protein